MPTYWYEMDLKESVDASEQKAYRVKTDIATMFSPATLCCNLIMRLFGEVLTHSISWIGYTLIISYTILLTMLILTAWWTKFILLLHLVKLRPLRTSHVELGRSCNQAHDMIQIVMSHPVGTKWMMLGCNGGRCGTDITMILMADYFWVLMYLVGGLCS